MTINKIYVGGRYGQVHLRATPPVEGCRPLVCLHATAYSSQTFEPLMVAMAPRRQVIAIDAPGYGGSDSPIASIAIADYADAAVEAARAAGATQFDLLGYHTGAYVAAEAAIRHPDTVGRLVLIGIPYFQALDFEAWRQRLCQPHRLGERLDQFAERWDYLVAARDPAISLDRAFANFRDELAAWPNGSWAHEAMFAWDGEARLPQVPTPTLVCNPDGHLAEASRQAAALMPDCVVVELPGVSGALFDAAPVRLAETIEPWLAGVVHASVATG